MKTFLGLSFSVCICDMSMGSYDLIELKRYFQLLLFTPALRYSV